MILVKRTISETVRGSATYLGYVGLSRMGKDEVYEQAHLNAITHAPPGTRKLSDVKPWETNYEIGVSLALGGISAVALVLAAMTGDTDLVAVVSLGFEGILLLASGLEIVEYTVVGVPVPPD